MSDLFDSYFKRLALEPAKTKPLTLEFIERVQQQHIATFSFNSVAVLLGRPFSLETEAIIDKLVDKNLGGYCFEHNKLIYQALKSLGYQVRCIIGKVCKDQQDDTPRTHRVTLLEWQGSQYLIDVGFGPNSPRGPIKIENGYTVEQAMACYQMSLQQDNTYQLALLKQGEASPLYTFDLALYSEADCEVANFYSCQHPQAVFMNNLLMTRIFPDKTLSLRNHQYYRIALDGTEIIDIADHFQLQTVAKEDFDISLSEDESLILFNKTAPAAI